MCPKSSIILARMVESNPKNLSFCVCVKSVGNGTCEGISIDSSGDLLFFSDGGSVVLWLSDCIDIGLYDKLLWPLWFLGTDYCNWCVSNSNWDTIFWWIYHSPDPGSRNWCIEMAESSSTVGRGNKKLSLTSLNQHIPRVIVTVKMIVASQKLR